MTDRFKRIPWDSVRRYLTEDEITNLIKSELPDINPTIVSFTHKEHPEKPIHESTSVMVTVNDCGYLTQNSDRMILGVCDLMEKDCYGIR